MNSILRSFVPPAVIDLRRKLRPDSPAFGSYAEALQHCGPGYNAEQIASVVVQKTRIAFSSPDPMIRDMRATTLALAIRTAASDTLNCLDFGGAAGAHYFQARQILGDRIKFRWHVVETPKMSELAGKTMAGDGLAFYSDVDAAVAAFGGSVDLLLCSGTLQCVPDPMATLGRLCSVGARHLLLTRTALADVPLTKRSIVQKSRLSENGPGPLPAGMPDGVVQYPATFADRMLLEDALSGRYSIDMRFAEERGAYMAGPQPISMYGYLASVR